jgi:hypothetical protein
MNLLRFTAALAAAQLFYGAPPARAESNQERGKRLVMECLSALGGERFLSMREREESGRAYSFYREQLNGLTVARIYTRYEPGVADTAHELAVSERENFGKKEESGVLFTAKEAWELTFRGARPIAEDRFARYKETTLRDVFYILRIRLREPGMIFESRGADVLQNRPVEIVDINDADNRTTTVYFDQTTKLPVRQIFERRDPATKLKDEEVTIFSKYREAGGIVWPYDIQRQRNGEKIFEVYSEAVQIDKAWPEKLFVLPAEVKRLKRL